MRSRWQRSLLGFALLAVIATGTALAETITGTNGPDVLRGTPAADRISGKLGNDRLFGLGGNDILVGGLGRDSLSGGPGTDRLVARDGERDTVACGPGRDTVVADQKDVARSDCEVVLRKVTQAPTPPEAPPPPSPPPPPSEATVMPGSYQGATQSANFVFFTVAGNRTVTSIRINDLPLGCNGGVYVPGPADFGSSVAPIDAAGRFSLANNWTGSDKVGETEWTMFSYVLNGFFNTPTSATGTMTVAAELNWKGQHYRCLSGEVRWTATIRP